MANSTKAFGLKPLGKVGGAYAAGSQSEYEIADAMASSIYQGDLVALSGGYVVPVQSSATGSILGVFNGCLVESDPSTGKPITMLVVQTLHQVKSKLISLMILISCT